MEILSELDAVLHSIATAPEAKTTNIKIGTLKRTCIHCECDSKSEQLEVNVSN